MHDRQQSTQELVKLTCSVTAGARPAINMRLTDSIDLQLTSDDRVEGKAHEV